MYLELSLGLQFQRPRVRCITSQSQSLTQKFHNMTERDMMTNKSHKPTFARNPIASGEEGVCEGAKQDFHPDLRQHNILSIQTIRYDILDIFWKVSVMVITRLHPAFL